MMDTAIHRMVELCRAGTNPAKVAKMPSGWAVMGSPQVLRGYCLLVPDPVVPHMNALTANDRTQFLADMAQLGDAILAATCALRINYAIFGNLEPALHAHVIPRFADEPEEFRTQTPWGYDWSLAPVYEEGAFGELRRALSVRLGT